MTCSLKFVYISHTEQGTGTQECFRTAISFNHFSKLTIFWTFRLHVTGETVAEKNSTAFQLRCLMQAQKVSSIIYSKNTCTLAAAGVLVTEARKLEDLEALK